jgi:single-strand DNA-binding protein
MNSVTLRGNLARDPELRYVNTSGRETAVVTLTVAVSRRFTRADGTTDEETTFVRCEAWDTAAENIAKNYKKGEAVLMLGQLKNDSWEKDGVKHNSLKVRITDFAKVLRDKKPANQSAPEVVAAASDAGSDPIPF